MRHARTQACGNQPDQGIDFVPLVITTCTNAKRGSAVDRLCMGTLARAPAEELCATWADSLSRRPTISVRHLYTGRAFGVAAKTAEALDARLLVVSAGLGLIDSANEVPSYACTILSGAADSIADRASDSVTPARWWRILQAASPYALPLSDAVAASGDAILVALSESYLEMLSDDLLALSPSDRDRLRLFTRAPLNRVPQALRPFVMPYDDRLEGDDSGRKGPRSYFAARAMAHFSETILTDTDRRSAAEHAAAVTHAIAAWRWPKTVERRRLADPELRALMEAHWQATGGVPSRLLKLFRHTLLVQCEQSRCKAMAASIRENRA